MDTTSRRVLIVLAFAGALQITALVVYFIVERGRAGRADPFAYEDITPPRPVPALAFEGIDEKMVRLDTFTQRPVLLHYWATWCAPCRAELPSLLAYTSDPARPTPVLVSLDENWDVIRHFFDGRVPPNVVRDVQSTSKQVDVQILPETLLLRAGGLHVARVRGARNWGTEDARETVEKLLASGR